MVRSFPINITINKEARCNLQCSYSFSYPPTSLQIVRFMDFGLYITVDETSLPPVIYNNNNYSVAYIFMIRPSLHKFAGEYADAEMLIIHSSEKSSKPLIVCIPITKSSISTTDATMFLDLIGSEISRTGTGSGATVFNSPTFTLNKFVPMKPYISYTGDASNTDTENLFDFIVFQKENAIYISTSTFDVLTKPSTMTDENGNDVETSLWPKLGSNNLVIVSKANTPAIFYNNIGPVPKTGDSIYISCQPTGADGEILTNILPNSSQAVDRLSIKSATNKILVKIVIGISLMIVIWKVAIKVINGLTGNKKPI